MTVARMGFESFVALAHRLGCVGIECRNDISDRLFDGLSPALAGGKIRSAGLRLLVLAEVGQFDRLDPVRLEETIVLLDAAAEAGAEGVALIPANDRAEQQSSNEFDPSGLTAAIELIAPHLEERSLTGLIEPLGFQTCAVRYKKPVVDLLNQLGQSGRFKLVHDTFHHEVAGDEDFCVAETGMVHISGVTDASLARNEMRDPHRELVDKQDRLGNVEQIRRLLDEGYEGPISFEAFSPAVYSLDNPFDKLAESIQWIDAALLEEAA
jgi:2-keto-myo-inositol isomerase